MKIVMFLKYKKEEGIYDEDIIDALTFDVSGRKVCFFRQEYLYSKNINYISLWLLNRQIPEVYVREADDKTRLYFKRIGITIKSYEELENKEFFTEYL